METVRQGVWFCDLKFVLCEKMWEVCQNEFKNSDDFVKMKWEVCFSEENVVGLVHI